MRSVAIANRHPGLRLDRRAVARVIQTLDAHHAELATRGSVLGNEGELSLVFLTDVALAELHDQFLQDPTITDVITFEGNPVLGTAGEICVSADAAFRQTLPSGDARHGAHATSDFSRELTLYLVHGWLHLAGYDDLAPAKKRVMRRAEARALALLESAGALPAFRLRTARRSQSARRATPRQARARGRSRR
ncbi:rRNA maturation RNase YbeY [Opitutus sp. ER46]|uniref:rRNA maturation RNase YbeY n=1 Tax=Opitutus sp. ER46 TaxID=2161864 RepID=UPI000D31D7EF|nr:rRNA maturation RNase YbeY [Opitutus sp. ER46]PTY00531.1 rRNA maturation RNase YbeY [Opitutus sp. ER46]